MHPNDTRHIRNSWPGLLLVGVFILVAWIIDPDFFDTEKIDENKAFEQPVLVCKSRWASCYHRTVCEGLGNCTARVDSIEMDWALSEGYLACGFCY